MGKRERILGGLGALLVVAYLVFMPGYILQQPRDWTLKKQQENQEPFSGIITLWHIVDFKPYTGSLGTWLSDRAAAFEKKHFGVFINVTAMTVEECAARMERGERADIYSFPMGWGYMERFMALPELDVTMRPALAHSGSQDGTAYGIPYAMSGYFLLINSRLEQEKGVSLPDDGWQASLQAAAEQLTFTYGKRTTQQYGLSGDPILAALLGYTGEVAPYSSFSGETAAMALADARAVGDLERQQSVGKGFTFRALPLKNYTDLVQYLGIARDTAAEKIPYIQDYFQIVLGEDNQEKLLDLGLLPAIELTVELGRLSGMVETMADALQTPKVPNAFLYQRYQDVLTSLAQRALAGDAQAREELTERMKELVDETQIQ